jgi:transglutaminase-like putative cysteine protease
VDPYLAADDVIDHDHPDVAALARELRTRHAGDDAAFTHAAFLRVRDGIDHSVDVQDRRVVVSASDTLREGVGLCFNKAHLFVALLRAGGVPAGLCYQRLADADYAGGFVVHGLAAVRGAVGWERQDPRGGDAPFPVRPELGEVDYPEVHAAAHPAVLAALRGATDMLELCAHDLPQELT